jgi:TPR repeat protein
MSGHLVKTDNPSRNPLQALAMFKQACESKHAPSCFNVAVMYNKGDTGVAIDQEKFLEFKTRTDELVKTYGGRMGGAKMA